MRRSMQVCLGSVCLASLLSASAPRARSAEQPAKKAATVKPPWQRLLEGEDAKKAEEQDEKLFRLLVVGQLTEALKIAEAVEELRAKVQGADHWQAIDARLTAETIRRVQKAKKEDQQSYCRAFATVREAEALRAKGRDREAQPLFEQVLAIYRKILGENYPETAKCYLNLATNLEAQGRYSEVEKSHRTALAIFRKELGEEHPVTGISYNNLARNLQAQGKYAEAEENYRKSLAIIRSVQGEEHLHTALSFNGIATNLEAQGKFREAEEYFRKALALVRKLLGEEHPYTALIYNNRASNLQSQGKYTEAQEGYRKALTIRRKVLGEEHPQTAESYNNVAHNLGAQSKYREAEESVRKALAIFRKVLGEDHLRTGIAYNNLGLYLQEQGKYREAEEGVQKALAIRRKWLGEEHPETALCYNNVAYNLYMQARYEEAEEGCRKALAIRRKVLGEEHPNTVTSHNNLAYNLYVQGKYQEAEKIWQRAAESFPKTRLHIAASGLERATITSQQSPLTSFPAVLARNGKPGDAWQRFEESLARGTWDDLTARLRQPQTERDKQAQITAHIDRLQKLIERASVANAPPAQAKQRDEWLGQLRQAYDELAAFTQQLEKNYGPIAGQVFARDQIQASLPADAALLGWLDIAGLPKAADPNGEHWAILLRSSGDPVWVRLTGSGDHNAWTDADTQLPGQLRAALQSSGSKWQALAERLRKQRLDPLAQHLNDVRHLIVLPSIALAGVPVEILADGYTVSYAHSGTMYAHLRRQPAPTGKGLFALADPIFEAPALAEKLQPLPPGGVLLTMVAPGSNAARAGLIRNDVLLRYGETDLAAPADFKPLPEAPASAKDVPVIVWRDGQTRKQPLFVRPGKLGVNLASEPAPQALAEQRRLDRLLASRSGDENKWDRLPGTRVEVAALQRLFGSEPSRVLLDSAASEQRLNELANAGELSTYRYIHLATHGEVDNSFPLRSAVILARDQLPDDKQRTDLLVSGQPIPDGRLTAEEVLRRWNLHADLVALSACQTALGKYERGEGFVGFAQALILSGSRSVCLSLWKVDDTATALLMERFYQNLLGKREGLDKPLTKAAALAEAKAWLRKLTRKEAIKRVTSLSNGVDRGKVPAFSPSKETPLPVDTREDHPFAHPRYWAAFILVGHAD